VPTEGVDYSWSRPEVGCLQRFGVSFVGRYTQPDDPGKSMSHDEAARLVEHGINLFTIHQPSGDKGWMLAGYQRGARAAQEALSVAEKQCGMPDDRPVYFALDVDPGPLSVAQWDAVRQCCRGAASILGAERVGVYGGWLTIERLTPTYARWGFQTRSWSLDPNTKQLRWHPRAQLQQYEHNVSMCGGLVDRVRAVADDYGAWDDP
jgi:hypothetical protein